MTSPILKPQFVTDANGDRVAVILSMDEFAAVTELLEDLADAEEIERRRGETSIPHETAMRLVEDDGALPD